MKKIISLTFCIITVMSAYAQLDPPPHPPGPPGGPDDEKTESLRIAFLSSYLNLTPEEGQKFWPVYNQMRDELKMVMDKEMQLQHDMDINKLSDAELNGLISSHFENEQQILNIKKKYAEEFKKVLPLKKVVLLADAENEFKRKLLEAAKERRGQGSFRDN